MPGVDRLDLCVRTKAFARPGATPLVVLRDIRFTATPGEVVAVLGRSGAGKSTLLRIAAGADHDFSGHLALPTRRIGMVFQEPRLLPWLTVTENLRLVVTAGAPVPDIAGLLASVGLSDAGPRRPSELSLGMARRIAIARALAVDPAFLVLDEPFVSLDRQRVARLGALLMAPTEHQRRLVLVATHDLDHALTIASRVLVLDGQPAVLAADAAVTDRADVAEVTRLRRGLLGRFPFLGAEERQDAGVGE